MVLCGKCTAIVMVMRLKNWTAAVGNTKFCGPCSEKLKERVVEVIQEKEAKK